VTIYDRLNLITKGLSNDKHTYNTPIVLFTEKPTRSTDVLSEALLCGIYSSTGHENIVTHYPSYTLSTNKQNKLNQAWINSGQTLGVELNVVENKAELLESAILSSVALEVVEELSRYRWNKQKEEEMRARDEHYKQLHEELRQRVADIREKVESMETIFDAKWSTPIDADSVKNMTKEK